MAIKMGIIIGGGIYGGRKLDQMWEFEIPWMTMICALLSVGLAMYSVIKDLSR